MKNTFKGYGSLSGKSTVAVLGISALLLLGAARSSRAQTTYTYYSGTSNAWLNATHWTVGGSAATKFPGVDNNSASTADGTTTDIAAIGAVGFTATNGVYGIGINFNTSAVTGVTANTGANGALSLGAVNLLSSATNDIQIGNSSTTLAGTFTLNGVTLNSVANTIAYNQGSKNLTFADPVNGTSSGSQTMTVALGNVTANVVQAAGSGNVIFNSIIANGAGSGLTINSAGAGAVLLNRVNTYTGGTTVAAGTLGGNGTIIGNTTVAAGAVLAPGATGGTSIGRFTMGTATTGATLLNGTYAVNLTGAATPTAGTSYDQISVLGALTLDTTNSVLSLTTASSTGLTAGQVLYIGLNDGSDAITGNFSNVAEGATVTDNLGDTFTISYVANGDGGAMGNDISLTVVTPVPEPTTVLGGALLVLATAWSQRRRLGAMLGLAA